MVTKTHNIRYLLEQWKTPEGKYITASIPELNKDYHYGPELRKHIVYQHHFNRVPQSKIHKELLEKGIQISKGQIDRILTNVANDLAQEKEAILNVGLYVSKYIQSDDTGARDQGKNAYCTIVANDLFAYFQTSLSKSRLNYLQILNGANKAHVINDTALRYMSQQKLSESTINLMKAHKSIQCNSFEEFKELFHGYPLKPKEFKTITEAALIGNLINNGFPEDMVVLSDDAGQFNLFEHALCWVHAERHIRKIVPIGELEKSEVNQVRELIWQLYNLMKKYKQNPVDQLKEQILNEFKNIFTLKVTCKPLANVLANIYKNESELLKICEKPFIPLHNNTCEQNLRDFVIKRKISGGSKSDSGRTARDTFNSLIQTCFKHKISFWEYLDDRIKKLKKIPPLTDFIVNSAAPGP